MADTFERIVVYASEIRPDKPGDHIDIVLMARGGTSRMLRLDKSGRWVAGEELMAAT